MKAVMNRTNTTSNTEGNMVANNKLLYEVVIVFTAVTDVCDELVEVDVMNVKF